MFRGAILTLHFNSFLKVRQKMKPKTRSTRPAAGKGRGGEKANSQTTAETISQTLEKLNLGPKARKQRRVVTESDSEPEDTELGAVGMADNGETRVNKKATTGSSWSEQDEAKLIELWQVEDHLFDKTSKDYRNALMKTRTIERMAAELNKDGMCETFLYINCSWPKLLA